MKHPFYYILIFVLLLPTFISCKSSNKINQDDIPIGNGRYFITNDSYDHDSYHNDIRSKGLRSKDTYIRIEGAIDIQPIRSRPESINGYGKSATIEVKSVNDKKFNVHDQSFNVSPQGTIFIINDSTINFLIKINKSNLRFSELKELPNKMKIIGNYTFYGDTVKHPLIIDAILSSDELNIYNRFVSGAIEEELGLTIDKSIVKGLVVEHHDYFNSDLPKLLSEFSSVETLYIRGFLNDQPFPEEIYSFKELKSITFDVTNVNADGSLKEHSETIFQLPERVFRIPKIKSLYFNHVYHFVFPEIPKGSSLERFIVMSSCIIDSLPNSFSNLTHLKYLSIYGTSIKSALPNNLNKLVLLETLKINLPDAVIPENFGPWSNIKKVEILQSNQSNIDKSEFKSRIEKNNQVLYNIFSNADELKINGVSSIMKN